MKLTRPLALTIILTLSVIAIVVSSQRQNMTIFYVSGMAAFGAAVLLAVTTIGEAMVKIEVPNKYVKQKSKGRYNDW